jgi:hypothetical protein
MLSPPINNQYSYENGKKGQNEKLKTIHEN